MDRIKFGWAVLFIAIVFPNHSKAGPGLYTPCTRSKVFTAQGIVAWSTVSNARGFFYKSGLAVVRMGPSGPTILKINWGLIRWFMQDGVETVTDNGKSSGRPIVQGKSDPAPGYYVSMTAPYDSANPNPRDPHSYVDALKIPYVVPHPKALKYARLGDVATVVNLQNGRISAALVADLSAPDLPVGEGSIALAKALGLDSSPRQGGTDKGIAYLIYSGSGNGK
jgi:hypothetical protein